MVSRRFRKKNRSKVVAKYKRPIMKLSVRKDLQTFFATGYKSVQLKELIPENSLIVRKIAFIFGGRLALAQCCNVRLETVGKWVERGVIPKEHWLRISNAPQSLGKLDIGTIAKLFYPAMTGRVRVNRRREPKKSKQRSLKKLEKVADKDFQEE